MRIKIYAKYSAPAFSVKTKGEEVGVNSLNCFLFDAQVGFLENSYKESTNVWATDQQKEPLKEELSPLKIRHLLGSLGRFGGGLAQFPNYLQQTGGVLQMGHTPINQECFNPGIELSEHPP